MFVGIVGSRNYPTLQQVQAFVASLARKYPDAVVVSGGARGVDSAAEAAALTYGLSVTSYRPVSSEEFPGGWQIAVWKDGEMLGLVTDSPVFSSFGRAAYARNRMIVQDADQVVAFTTGSRGTANSIGIARQLGIPVHTYGPPIARSQEAVANAPKRVIFVGSTQVNGDIAL